MLEKAVANFLATHNNHEPPIRRLVVGFSGGLDSTVLLHVLAKQAPAQGFALYAVHIHHGLSPHADAWAAQAQAQANHLHIPCQILRVRLPMRASLEAAARQARYQALATVLQEGDALLLAQHQDDQAETVLLRLFRGSGVTGLSAMRAVDQFPFSQTINVPVWRPLLALSRDTLMAYAQRFSLTWVEDESNQDTRLNRNFLRQHIMPDLRSRWPALPKGLAATAARMQEADALLQEMAKTLACAAITEDGRLRVEQVVRLALEANGVAKQNLVLRYWLKGQLPQPPDEKSLEILRTQVLQAKPDACPVLCLGAYEVRRYRQYAYVIPALAPIPSDWVTTWHLNEPLLLPDGRVLTASTQKTAATLSYRVSFRQGGEVLFYRSQRRDIKKLLQEKGVPPWERERLPLLWQGENLVAVIGNSWQITALEGVDFQITLADQRLDTLSSNSRDNDEE